MILNATTKKVQILLGSAVTANQCPVVVDYVDFSSTATTPGMQLSNSNSTTAADILAAPAASTQRKVNLITVCNKDTLVVTVTIRLNDNGTTYNYLSGLVLPPNCTLQFTDMDGWSVINPDGSICLSTVSGAAVDVQSFTTSGTWTRPASANFVQVDAVGGGGNGAADVGCDAGGGGGGGAHNQFMFLVSELTDTVSVTVGGGGGGTSSFGTYLSGIGGGNAAAGQLAPGASQGVITTSSSANQPDSVGGPAGGFSSYMAGGGGSNQGGSGGSSFFSAGGGGGGSAGGKAGGSATTAGGGGNVAGVGTIKMGDGGSGIAGSIPGGGGGFGSNAGARGQVWVVSW
jgi:hypothetical protein